MKRRIISYDIRDDKRRRQVVKRLQQCAHRVQYSVFEGRLRKGRWERLWEDLLAIIDEESDSLMMIPICERCQTKRHRGGASEDVDVGDVIIV